MGIHRLPNGIVRGAAGAPKARDQLSPRHSPRCQALKRGSIERGPTARRMRFLALLAFYSRIRVDATVLARMIRRRWRDRILSGHTAFTFQIVQASVLVLFAIAPISNFWRSQKSFRLAAVSRLQSRASSLRTDEQNDHAGPHQRPASEFAG